MNVPLTQRFISAVAKAHELHASQERPGSGAPYLTHLLGAAANVLHFGGDEDQAIAALLHGVAADGDARATLETIREAFGARVADLVAGCRDAFDSAEPAWRARKEAYLARLATTPRDILLVAAADKLDDARAIVTDLRTRGSQAWSHLPGGRSGSLWYYTALAATLARAGVGSIAVALEATLDEMANAAVDCEVDDRVALAEQFGCLALSAVQA
ncbi:metal dependent phosphohydrolase [Anaeromyxobacter sp. K]|uniref:HD domain-containing protein n=1 Tax=Anaeromyxobacter sp. (strain K) TaxID=447217 RepID=UPI00015F8A0D|nr:HD domain-containing protein [Anaeromyxobacter sp. K]ACG75192.1 metal dependent phosphohydrolase [Anaeromyxobacter sp. K]